MVLTERQWGTLAMALADTSFEYYDNGGELVKNAESAMFLSVRNLVTNTEIKPNGKHKPLRLSPEQNDYVRNMIVQLIDIEEDKADNDPEEADIRYLKRLKSLLKRI